MTNAEKLAMTKAFLGIEGDEEDELIMHYLEAAAREIITWKYGNENITAPEPVVEETEDEIVTLNEDEADDAEETPEEVEKPFKMRDVDMEDEFVQINAVVTGYNLVGMENQLSHSENGISRTFKYPSMVAYIRSNVRAHVRLCI